MEDAQRFPAWEAWAALTDKQRRAVARLAKQGREHTDELVAEAARGWAEVLVVNGDVWQEDRWWRRIAFVPGLLLGGYSGVTDWLEHRAEQRWARRVLHASRAQR